MPRAPARSPLSAVTPPPPSAPLAAPVALAAGQRWECCSPAAFSCSPASLSSAMTESAMTEPPSPRPAAPAGAGAPFAKQPLASPPPRPPSALSRLLTSSPHPDPRRRHMARFLSAPDLSSRMDLETYERAVAPARERRESETRERRDSGASVGPASPVDSKPACDLPPAAPRYRDSVLDPAIRFAAHARAG